MESEEIQKIKKAGEIHKKVVDFARDLVKPGMKLLEIADKIDDKILELGGKPAFPVNLSIDEVAAHATPSWNSEEIAKGLLKVDIGIHIDGYVADGAFSVDLEKEGSEESELNKKLIEAAEVGLKEDLSVFGEGVKLSEVGSAVQKAVKEKGFNPIHNLSGHSIERYNLHSGVNIPNVDVGQVYKIEKGLYAVEPFTTNGFGKVRDGKPSGIYHLEGGGNVRDNFAREVLEFIAEEYQTLPFCARWIYKKFSSRGLLALRQIEQAGILHHYPQLIEIGKGKVAQAEHTVLITEEGKFVTTK